MEPTPLSFIAGATAFGFALGALGFFRLWFRSHDPFFIAFAMAFLLLVLPPLSILWSTPEEARVWIYLVRVLAYLLISGAIVLKNRRRFDFRQRNRPTLT